MASLQESNLWNVHERWGGGGGGGREKSKSLVWQGKV